MFKLYKTPTPHLSQLSSILNVRLNSLISLVFMSTLTGCLGGKSQSEAKPSAQAQLESQVQMAEQGMTMKNLVQSAEYVIDVRSQTEWDAGHLPNAIHIPLPEIADKIRLVIPQKDAPIYLYCASGGRSAMAHQKLKSMGYSQAINAGGYQELK